MSFYRLHVFACTNKRPEGHKRGSCAQGGAEDLRNYLKSRAKEIGLADIRINSAGCLDRCEAGPVLVVYPQGVWYHYQNQQDIDEILTEHLQSGRIVERLRLNDADKTWPPTALA